MNKVLSKIFKKNSKCKIILSCLLFSITTIIFLSCENFLDSGTVKEELESIIAYNNAKVVNLSLVCDEEVGTLFPNQTYQARVGYPFELQFIPNTDNYKIKDLTQIFEAVSIKDNSSRSDYIKIDVIEQSFEDKKSGVYRANITVLKEADDLKIHPNCISLPKILQITPENSSGGCDQNTPIKIKFNKPVDNTTFNFDDISIMNGNISLKEYFDEPYFSSDKTVITIPVKLDKFLIPPESSKLQMDITVVFNTNNLTDCDGLAIPQIPTHQYRINKNFAGQKKVTVLIRTVEGVGSFLVDGEKEGVVGYSLGELQFTSNKKTCVFTGLEAVSKNDNSVSRNDCVEFTTISSNDETGVYTIKVRILEEVNDILIRPKYILRPAVVDYSPKNTDYLTVPIYITFNGPVEDESVSVEKSVFNYTNVSIRCENQSINNCFNTPVLNKAKTVLSLVPKTDKLTAFFREKGLSTTNITISFDSRTQFNIENTLVKFAEDKALDFTIHYTVELETTPPQKINFGASREWNSGTSLPQNTFYQSEEHFTYDVNADDINQDLGYLRDYTDDQILQNRTKGIVFIYGKYKDTDSNVQTISINEEYLDSEVPIDPTRNISIDYNEKSDEIIMWQTDSETGITSYCIKHEIQHEDGAIQLSVTVFDGCGNSATTEYLTIFNVTKVNLRYAVPVNAYYNLYDYYYDDEVDFNMNTFKNNVKNIKLIYDSYGYEDLIYEDNIFCAYYGNREFDPEGIITKIECEYIDDSSELRTLPMTKSDQNEYPDAKIWNCDLINVEHVNGLKITINVEDDLGNIGYEEYIFPSERKIESVVTNGNTKTIRLSKVPDTPNCGLIIYKGINESDNAWKTLKIDSEFTIEKGYEYHYISTDTWYFTSELSSKYTYDSDFSVPEYVIDFEEEPELEPAENGKYNINVTIPQEAWNYYDNIFVKHSYGSGSYYYYFEPYDTHRTITTYTTTLFRYDNTITLFGEKNNKCKQGKSKTFKLTDSKYDNIPPRTTDSQAWHDPDDITHYNILLFEEPTELQSVTFNGKTYGFTKYDNNGRYKVSLNLYDCIDYTIPEQPRYNFTLTATDEANNTSEIIFNEYISRTETPIVQSKTSSTPSTWTFRNSKMVGGVIIYTFNNDSKIWDRYTYSFSSYTRTYPSSSSSSSEPVFLKVTSEFGPPKYYYYNNSSNFSNSGKYDYILPNGSAKDSVVISSDAPVYVHTVVSSYPYETCKNWTVDDWEFYKKTLGDEQFNFSVHDQQKYNIPYEDINKNECYVVIAHFADGTSAMSDVMVKY